MIRSVLLAALCVVPPTLAGEREPAPPAVDDAPKKEPEAPAAVPTARPEEARAATPDDKTVESWRSPFEVLSERMIGAASRAVLFDWRKKTVALGVTGGPLLELNNFPSGRLGGFVRVPFGNLTAELAVTRVFTYSSDAGEKLALTPYRQAGRPNRIEFDLNLAYAILEGVGTPRVGFLPTVELVFTFNAGFRYLYYPNALGTANAGQVIEGLLSPKLQAREIEYLERERLPGMQVDAGRYNLLAGFELNLYFRTGIFLAPRVMMNIPIFSGAANSSLGLWWELNLSLGWML